MVRTKVTTCVRRITKVQNLLEKNFISSFARRLKMIFNLLDCWETEIPPLLQHIWGRVIHPQHQNQGSVVTRLAARQPIDILPIALTFPPHPDHHIPRLAPFCTDGVHRKDVRCVRDEKLVCAVRGDAPPLTRHVPWYTNDIVIGAREPAVGKLSGLVVV